VQRKSSRLIHLRREKSMKQGFTLIELIVAVTIMMVLLSVTIVGFSSYNQKQRVKQAALSLKSDLHMARTNATSGKKPISCTSDETFEGYDVSFTTSSYSVAPSCSSTGQVDVETVVLPTGVTFDPIPSFFTYYPLTQGASTPPSQIILTDGINVVPLTLDALTGDVSN
jgi:prepilin-type N-terminal cleavage/methylation domain-containing protein